MGYCLDPASDQIPSRVKMQAIRKWVDGVLTCIGAKWALSPATNCWTQWQTYRLDAVQVNMWVEAAELEALQGRADILREVVG